MNLSPADKRYLRASIVMLTLALLFGAGAAGASYYYWQQTQQQNRIARNQEIETRQRLAQAAQEEVELKAKIGRYLQLKAQGIIGPERRLDWVEHLAQLRRERKLGDLQYELSAQHPVERQLLAGGVEAGGHRFVTSTLKLGASLLHEGDLAQLLDDIGQRLSAQSSLRHCQIERRPSQPGTPTLNYALRGECELELVTIQEPGA